MNKLFKTTLFLSVASSAFLVACSRDIDRGRVTGKEHHDAWTQPMVTMAGKTPLTVMIQRPERWTLLIAHGNKTGFCDVTKAEWDRAKTGDWIACN